MSDTPPRSPARFRHQHRADLSFDPNCPECKRLLDEAGTRFARNAELRAPPSSLAVAQAELRASVRELGRVTFAAATRQAIAIGRALRR